MQLSVILYSVFCLLMWNILKVLIVTKDFFLVLNEYILMVGWNGPFKLWMLRLLNSTSSRSRRIISRWENIMSLLVLCMQMIGRLNVRKLWLEFYLSFHLLLLLNMQRTTRRNNNIINMLEITMTLSTWQGGTCNPFRKWLDWGVWN